MNSLQELPLLFEERQRLSEDYFSLLCKLWSIQLKSGWPDKFGQKLSEWSNGKVKIKTLSLFSGCGGLDIGFHDSGFTIDTMVEVEKKFSETLKANSGRGKYFGENVKVLNIDIREFNPSNEHYDFIIGGPPCQTFSAAGRRAAGVIGTKDDRGNLFEEYVRILDIIKPTGFLFENVYGITGAEKGEAWKRIQEAFSSIGYSIQYRILDTAGFGVPQHRERLIIVGCREKKFRFPKPTHGLDSKSKKEYYSAQEAISDLNLNIQDESVLKIKGKFSHLIPEIPPGLNYSFFTEKMGHPKPIFSWRSKFSDFMYKADPKVPVRTIKAQAGAYTGPFHWNNRFFSIEELKRLQTIPDDYTIIGNRSEVLHQIGNSVPPQFARILAISILQELFNINLPAVIEIMDDTENLSFRKRKRDLTNIYKEKAKKGLSENNNKKNRLKLYTREYSARLDKNFKLSEDNDGNLKVKVEFGKNCLNINIECISKVQEKSIIEIRPVTNGSWSMGFTSIILSTNYLSKETFSALWKALEAELSKNEIKADLVQLCNYYQYSPSFMSKFKTSHNSTEWSVVGKILQGIGIRTILHKKYLADLWGIQETQIDTTASFLKEIGYEIRNCNTNPQIEKDHYLVPYSFPTLNYMSVQLKKGL